MLMPYLQTTQDAVRYGLSMYLEDAQLLEQQIARRRDLLWMIANAISADEYMAKAVHLQLLGEAIDVAMGRGDHLLQLCEMNSAASMPDDAATIAYEIAATVADEIMSNLRT